MTAALSFLAIGLFLLPFRTTADGVVRIAVPPASGDVDFAAHIFERRAAEALARELMKHLPPPPCETNLAFSLLCDHLLLSGAAGKSDSFLVSASAPSNESVWEIPPSKLAEMAESWSNVFATVSAPENFSSHFFHPARAMEVAPRSEQAVLRAEFVKRVLHRYGLPCARFWSDGLPIGFSPRLAAALRTDFLEGATGHDLMLLLGEVPGDPRIIAELAKRFEGLGMKTAAEWLASRGFMAFIDYAASSRCREIVAKSESFVMSSFEGGFPHEILLELTRNADFRGTALSVYDLWRRPFPGGSPLPPSPSDENFSRGVELLRSEKPDVGKAYLQFLESVAGSITFAACVFAGECAFRLEKYPEASMLFWQALCTHAPGKNEIPWFGLYRSSARLNCPGAREYCRKRLAGLEISEEMRQVLAAENLEVDNGRK